MGRSYTPPYRLELFENSRQLRPQMMSWTVKTHGRPTEGNLEKVVMSYAASLKIGGCNEHISKMLGYIPYPSAARVIRQADNAVVASWKAGMFQVFP